MKDHTEDRLFGLDHLRTVAIMFVFLFHYFVLSGGKPEWIVEVARFMWTGVDLFYVLSGFLISSQLFEQIRNHRKISFKSFFIKRFFRIIPAFWVTLAIYFCIPFFHERESLPPLWKFLTFTQNFGLSFKENGTFSHAWSLCVEEHFYFLLPLTLILLQFIKLTKRAYWIIIVLFFIGFATRIYSYHLYLPHEEVKGGWSFWYQYVYYPTYNRLDGLLAGVSIAALYKFLPNLWGQISKYGNVLILLSLAVLTGAYFLCYHQHSFSASVFGFPLIAIGYGLLVMAAISPTSVLFKWKSKLTAFIAAISYAVYLTHKGLIHITHEIFKDIQLDYNLLLLFSALMCIAGAFILHLVVEKPFMNLRKRVVKQ